MPKHIHRTRFTDYTPAAITASAFSHRSSPGDQPSQALRCAIGRANGDIEIWDPKDNWTHDITLRGGKGRSIEGLVWVTQKKQSPRLFSIGSSSQITEWSLDRLRPLISVDCNAGSIWSIAASPDQDSLAVGCEDGTLVMLDIAGGPGVLEYKHALTRQKSRILSLAFIDDSKIVGGCSDSTLKIWDCSQARGQILTRMAVDRVRNEPTLVWSVLVLRNGTIASGDSTGSVKLWDKKFYALLQNFKLHGADVLCLVANYSGDLLYSAGVDRKTQMYQLVDNKKRWAHVSGRHYHSHDIRTSSIYEGRGTSLMVSGGVDMTLALIPLRGSGNSLHRMLPAVPQKPRCVLARSARLLLQFTDNEIKIWRLCEAFDLDNEPRQALVCKMKLQNEENLSSVAISQDGQYVLVSTHRETKLFLLMPSDKSHALRPVKILSEELAERGSQHSAFSQDGSRICLVNPESEISIHELIRSEVSVDDDMFDIQVGPATISTDTGAGQVKRGQTYMKSFRNLALSEDGQTVAVSYQDNTVAIYGTDGSLQSSLPSMPSAITAMTLAAGDLILVLADMSILAFNTQSGSLNEWSKANSPNIPDRFTKLVDHCCGAQVDADQRLWMWGANWVSFIDLTLPLPVTQQSKRKRDDMTKALKNGPATEEEIEEQEPEYEPSKNHFWITFKYRSMLLFDVLSDNELLVVERPVMDMLNSPDMPPPFHVKKYGHS